MKAVTLYESFDGKTFADPDLCRAYEAENVETRVLGLTHEHLASALSNIDTGLRDALEEIGRRCGNARRAAGEFRRTPKAQAGEAGKTPDPRQAPDAGYAPGDTQAETEQQP